MSRDEKWLAIPERISSLESPAFEKALSYSRTAVGTEATVKLLHDLVRLVDERNAKMREQRAFQDWPRVDLVIEGSLDMAVPEEQRAVSYIARCGRKANVYVSTSEAAS